MLIAKQSDYLIQNGERDPLSRATNKHLTWVSTKGTSNGVKKQEEGAILSYYLSLRLRFLRYIRRQICSFASFVGAQLHFQLHFVTELRASVIS